MSMRSIHWAAPGQYGAVRTILPTIIERLLVSYKTLAPQIWLSWIIGLFLRIRSPGESPAGSISIATALAS